MQLVRTQQRRASANILIQETQLTDWPAGRGISAHYPLSLSVFQPQSLSLSSLRLEGGVSRSNTKIQKEVVASRLLVNGRLLADGRVVVADGILGDGRVAAGDHAGVGLEGLVGLVCRIH